MASSERFLRAAMTVVVLAGSSGFAAAAPDSPSEAPSKPKVVETLGPTYPVKEPSLFEQFEAHLRKQRDSGELARVEKEGREKALASIQSPPPVEGLRIARQDRRWTYDPSIQATTDVRDASGNVIVKRGTSVSPADVGAKWKPMVFFDARDPAQVRYARKTIAAWEKDGAVAKPILVAGSWMELMKGWQRQVFYDQAGTLTQRFGIKATPATVVQQGRILAISEIALETQQ